MRCGGHLHLASALERDIQLERLADGTGRVRRGIPPDRGLLFGWRLGLVEAAEIVAVELQRGTGPFVVETSLSIFGRSKYFLPGVDCSTSADASIFMLSQS